MVRASGRWKVASFLIRVLLVVFLAFIPFVVRAGDSTTETTTAQLSSSVKAVQPAFGAGTSVAALSYDPGAGLVYREGDFKWTLWGYAERLIDPKDDSNSKWRRFRQGSEFDFPRITDWLRPAFVYEIDMVDSDFFRNGIGGTKGFGRRNLENFFVAIQDVADPTQLRALFGQNPHILSREDNLSSGNLPTINRSLILEEHGTVNTFGAQFGFEYTKALSPQYSIALAALDNRGSFNVDQPRYSVGNSLSAKLSATPLNYKDSGQRLTWGIGVDNTMDVHNGLFRLLTAIGQGDLGAIPAEGNKFTIEGDVAYTFKAFGHPVTLEAEGLYSNFHSTRTNVGGGYVMARFSVFDNVNWGDLDLFIRHDAVNVSAAGLSGNAVQQAVRFGFNYNPPHLRKLVNIHLEYAHNRIDGPASIVRGPRDSDEFMLELRASLQPYIRH